MPHPPALPRSRGGVGKWILIVVSGMIGLSVLGGLALYKIGASVAAASPASVVVPWSDKYVSKVREGVLHSPFDTTTVSKAFEGTFNNCKWESYQSEKGVRVVQFTGRLKPEMYREALTIGIEDHNICLAHPPQYLHVDQPEACGPVPDEIKWSTVAFQFLFTADEQSFKLGYFDPAPWSHTGLRSYDWRDRPTTLTEKDVLKYIYQ